MAPISLPHFTYPGEVRNIVGPDKRGDLNGSMQHWLERLLARVSRAKVVRERNSKRALPCLGLIAPRRTDRLSSRSIVGSNDYKVLRRPSELARLLGQIPARCSTCSGLGHVEVQRESSFLSAPRPPCSYIAPQGSPSMDTIPASAF
jgi:hypothetical protein